MRALIGLLAMLTAAGCEPVNEVSNPRLFHVMAIKSGADGETAFVDSSASFQCEDFSCSETRQRNVLDVLGGGSSETVTRCHCVGPYVLKAKGGLEIHFEDRSAIGSGSHFSSDEDEHFSSDEGELTIRYKGNVGTGAAHISSTKRFSTETGSYYMDIAGGFEFVAGDDTFTRGFFYSILPETH